MTPHDDQARVEMENCYELEPGNTVTVEDCPFCGETHLFAIDPRWETIQKARMALPELPEGVKKFIVECPKQRGLFEIYVKVN